MGHRNFPRVITSIFTSNTVLFALTTSPANAAIVGPNVQDSVTPNAGSILHRQETGERVVVKSRGRNLDFTVAGAPGRLCAVAYRTADMKQGDWKPLPNTRALIGGTGLVVVSLDMTPFLDKEVSFTLMTSFIEPFDGRNPDIRGTAPFVIHMSSKQVSAIAEVQRPTQKGVAAAGAAAAYRNLGSVRTSLLLNQESSERVVVKSRGKNLDFTIAGAPGRMCALAYRTADMARNSWLPLPNTKAVIGGSGVVVVSLDMTPFLDKEVSFSLLTSFTGPLHGRSPDFRGTAPFVIHMSSQQVSAIPEMQRLTGRGLAAAAASTAASVGYAPGGQQR